MEIKHIKAKHLLEGKVFEFSSLPGNEGKSIGELFFFNKTKRFLIFFNGQCIHSSATCYPAISRLKKLFEKWDLHLKQ